MSNKKYDVFISYRKSHAVNADFIRKSIEDECSYTNVFLDKHEIGPELFDERIKTSLLNSSCVVVLITKDCFRPKENGDDWFLREVKTALEKGIVIIPLLFDGIKSLSELEDDMKKSFSDEERVRLKKTQAISYSEEYPDASINKLVSFIEQTNNKVSFKKKVTRTVKGILVLIALLITAFFLFFGMGVLWGYFTTSTDYESILAENSIIEGSKIKYEFEKCKVTFDLEKDTVIYDCGSSTKILGAKPQADNISNLKIKNSELILSSFSLSGIKIILDKNLSNLKYVRFLKNGSKPSKIILACATVGAFVGTVCGFSQGSNFGRTKRQEEKALELYPMLEKRSTWYSLIRENLILKFVYDRNKVKRENRELINTYNCIGIVKSYGLSSIAYSIGLTGSYVLLKYNDWEIGKKMYKELQHEIEKSKDKEKNIVVLDMKNLTIAEYDLPKGIVGLSFSPCDGGQERYNYALHKFTEWRLNN